MNIFIRVYQIFLEMGNMTLMTEMSLDCFLKPQRKGRLPVFKTNKESFLSDRDALAKDCREIGKDMRKAMDQYAERT
jgi:hypothetical protein